MVELLRTIDNRIHAGISTKVRILHFDSGLFDVGVVEAGIGNRGAAGEQCNAEDDSEKFVSKRFNNRESI